MIWGQNFQDIKQWSLLAAYYNSLKSFAKIAATQKAIKHHWKKLWKKKEIMEDVTQQKETSTGLDVLTLLRWEYSSDLYTESMQFLSKSSLALL